MAPLFMFSVLCSSDDTSFHVFDTLFHENSKTGAIGGVEHRKMKTGVISGAEHRKNENWCHRWSRIPKTCTRVFISFYVFGFVLHR
jgi:hypothetical protein